MTIEVTQTATRVTNSVTQTETKKMNFLDRHAASFEKARFFWMALTITFQSCLASIACAFILKGQTGDIALASCAAVTMGCNAVFIAQAPAKVCLIAFYLSVALNTAFIIVSI